MLTEYEYGAIVRGRSLKDASLEHEFRRLAFFLINVNVEKKHQLKRYSDVWKIPAIDGEQKEESEEDQKANYTYFKELVEKYKK